MVYFPDFILLVLCCCLYFYMIILFLFILKKIFSLLKFRYFIIYFIARYKIWKLYITLKKCTSYCFLPTLP